MFQKKEKSSKASINRRPKIIYPNPIAMQQIEKFLDENRWRLIDLFRELDKDKDWHVFKDDFIRSCKNKRLEIRDYALDELVNALGTNAANAINYKSLAQGRSSHLSERRSQLRGV